MAAAVALLASACAQAPVNPIPEPARRSVTSISGDVLKHSDTSKLGARGSSEDAQLGAQQGASILPGGGGIVGLAEGRVRRHNGAGRCHAQPGGLRAHDEHQGLSDQPRPSRSRGRPNHCFARRTKKPIYALPSVTADLVETYFNWKARSNFTDRGKAPLKKYALSDLAAGAATPLKDTAMTVTAFPLSHGGMESTAFLLDSGGDALLCFGDTGLDAVEKGTRLHDVWAAVAERVKEKRLKAIVIESSYTSDRPDNLLFGHLTPRWVLELLRELDKLAGGKALKDLPVVVSHIKYSLTREQPQKQMLQELEAGNDFGVRFVIPEQGSRWHFK